MKAVVWNGKKDVRVETVPDPRLLNPRDAIVKITATAICGSDLHLYNGFVPSMKAGDILGHEFMGEVVEVGPGVKNLKPGDRVVVPFCIACGDCFYCENELWSLCDNTNPNATVNAKMNGYQTAGLFGFSHLYGGYAGGQAQYARVPFADVGPLKIETNLSDEQVLFLSDIFPTGYMAADNCGIKPGQIVAVWGCGPVGQFAIRSAYLLGAGKVIAIDNVAERLRMAEEGGAVTVSSDDDVHEILKDMTGGRGPDACIDAVGMEAHGSTYDNVKQSLRLETDRPYVLRQAIRACRKGGVLSIPGLYSGVIDKVPFGIAFAKGLALRMGQTHMHKYMPRLLQRIEQNEIDPSFLITHRLRLESAPSAYTMFLEKRNGCVKVVLDPHARKSDVPTAASGRRPEAREVFSQPRSKRLRKA